MRDGAHAVLVLRPKTAFGAKEVTAPHSFLPLPHTSVASNLRVANQA